MVKGRTSPTLVKKPAAGGSRTAAGGTYGDFAPSPSAQSSTDSSDLPSGGTDAPAPGQPPELSAADSSTVAGVRLSRDERIRARAYERFRRRGGNGDTAVDDWLQAEAEVDALDELDRSGS